jgi:hypothetical protein
MVWMLSSGLPEAREYAIEIVQEAEKTILYLQNEPYSKTRKPRFCQS